MPAITIDIETLATTTDAVILSIAAIKFNELSDPSEPNLETFQVLVDLESEPDRSINDQTLDWWAQQDPVVQAIVFSETGRIPIADALQSLSKFVWNSNRIWVQGPVFDIPILEHAFHQCNLPTPWQYYQIRDSRTLLDLVELNLPKANHNALDDCARQIQGIKLALKQLNVSKFSRA